MGIYEYDIIDPFIFRRQWTLTTAIDLEETENLQHFMEQVLSFAFFQP